VTGAVAGAAAALGVDGVELREALEPASPEALADALRGVAARGGAVLVRGGGTRLGCGNPLRRADALLSTRGLARIVELDADEGVACVEAGVPLAALRAAVEPTGWELPLDPPGAGSTLGGALAAAAPGPRHPHPRDAVLGMEVALAGGARARSGGRVVKNVTGYDLPKLFTGSFGALGVIASAWIRLRPRPERCELLVAPLAAENAAPGAGRALAPGEAPSAGRASAGGASAALALAAARLPTARAALVVDAALVSALRGHVPVADRDASLLLVELAGDAAAVALDADALRERCRAEPAAPEALEVARGLTGAAALPGAPAADLLVRVDVVATRVAAAAARLRAAGAAVVAQPARGLVHARLALGGDGPARACDALLAAARAAAAEGAGGVRIEAAPRSVREAHDVFGERGPRLALLRRLKQAFDPQGVLNPGRFAGRL